MKHFLKPCVKCGNINKRPISLICRECALKDIVEYQKRYDRKFMKDYMRRRRLVKMRKTCIVCGITLYQHNLSPIRNDACAYCYPKYDEKKEFEIKKYINELNQDRIR